MLKHIYINTLKCLVREKNTIFWLLLFPMILAVFFKMGFSGLGDEDQFKIISVAFVEDEQSEMITVYKSIFDELGDMLKVSYVTEEEAKKMLKDGDVDSYIYMEENRLSMMIMESGVNQNIVKTILDKINDGVNMVMSGTVTIDELASVLNVENVIENQELSGEKQDFVSAWFYTILGMTAMYASMMGVWIVKYVQGNQSATAIRYNLAPVPKLKGFVAMFLATATVQTVIMTLVYLYLRFVMNINFGDRHGYIILASAVGAITGVAVGAMIGVVVKSSENMKIGICMAVSMLGSYLAGMMDNSMKYTVMKSMPIVEYINPAGIISDSYLKLYYYEDLSYFWSNIVNLLAIIVICIVVTVLMLRRQRYDSI